MSFDLPAHTFKRISKAEVSVAAPAQGTICFRPSSILPLSEIGRRKRGGAINDGLVSSFFNKYHYNFWRPEAAIRSGTDGDPKTDPAPDWKSFITPPRFPGYPSNHGSAGNAAELLRRLYGEAGHSMKLSNPATPTIALQYDTFREITDDISDARVYGGIHFRTDQEAGGIWGGQSELRFTRTTCVPCTITTKGSLSEGSEESSEQLDRLVG